MVTSPPIGTSSHMKAVRGQLGLIEDYESFLRADKVWSECLRVLVPGGAPGGGCR